MKLGIKKGGDKMSIKVRPSRSIVMYMYNSTTNILIACTIYVAKIRNAMKKKRRGKMKKVSNGCNLSSGFSNGAHPLYSKDLASSCCRIRVYLQTILTKSVVNKQLSIIL